MTPAQQLMLLRGPSAAGGRRTAGGKLAVFDTLEEALKFAESRKHGTVERRNSSPRR